MSGNELLAQVHTFSSLASMAVFLGCEQLAAPWAEAMQRNTDLGQFSHPKTSMSNKMQNPRLLVASQEVRHALESLEGPRYLRCWQGTISFLHHPVLGAFTKRWGTIQEVHAESIKIARNRCQARMRIQLGSEREEVAQSDSKRNF